MVYRTLRLFVLVGYDKLKVRYRMLTIDRARAAATALTGAARLRDLVTVDPVHYDRPTVRKRLRDMQVRFRRVGEISLLLFA